MGRVLVEYEVVGGDEAVEFVVVGRIVDGVLGYQCKEPLE